MLDHQRRFLQLALDAQALRFGEFTLKSGRVSPYFFNAGAFDRGGALAAFGECYAEAALASGIGFDMLFGPAYKGIPLATATAIALAARGRDLPLAFDRKEAKDHGEGGRLIGAKPSGRVLIVDDVITAGTAVRGAIALLRESGAEVAGLLVALDRQERGQGELSAAEELARDLGVNVTAIAGLDALLEFAGDEPGLVKHKDSLLSYRARYGTVQGTFPP